MLGIDESACRLLLQISGILSARDVKLVFSRATHLSTLRRYIKVKLGERFESDFRSFEDNDGALEWCEESFLGKRLPARLQSEPRAIEQYELFEGLTPEAIKHAGSLLQLKTYSAGEVIVETGAEAGDIYFLRRGSATITLALASGASKRLGVFSEGMSFGEVAMLDGARRSATVIAATDVECHTLSRSDFEALGQTHPHIKIVLLTNMALGLAKLLRKTTQEFSVFDY